MCHFMIKFLPFNGGENLDIYDKTTYRTINIISRNRNVSEQFLETQAKMELRPKNVDKVPQRLVNPSVVRCVLNPYNLKAGEQHDLNGPKSV